MIHHNHRNNQHRRRYHYFDLIGHIRVTTIQFNSIQFYCKIGMTEVRSLWTEYKMNKQIYKQRTAEHNRLRQTVIREHSPGMYMHTQNSKRKDNACTTFG